MDNIKKYINKALEVICVFLFAFITVIGSYQIITRYVFNSPSTVSEELLTFSFTWLALLSASLVFGKREHMRMSYIADKFKGKSAIILSILTEILVLGFAGLILIYGGVAITKLTFTQITASLGVPMAYIYVVTPISGALTAIYSVINILEDIRRLSKADWEG